jgi:hypothetical protein
MKRFGFIAAALGLAGLVYVLGPGKSTSPAPADPPDPPASQPLSSPAAVKIDPAEVFQRAFWQPPGSGDQILHAERREWTDAGGVKQWQWFLVVEPSPELVKYLREDNAFGLVPASTLPEMTDAPAWFAVRPGEVDALRAPQGRMNLFFSKTQRLLHATSSGAGFRPGAPEAVKEPPARQSPAGRLPGTPPPSPAQR